MEGPTPSSAIFYGAISIHAGAYLLLRVQPMLAQSGLASALVIAIGIATAIHGTIVGRASADAKTSLAYASLTQVGVVFVEIGIGWTTDRAWSTSWDTPRFGRCSFCGRRRCCTTITRCNRRSEANSRQPESTWRSCFRMACSCGSTGGRWIAAISTPSWIVG